MALSRRELLQSGAAGAAALTFGPLWLKQALAAPATAGASPYGALLPPDANSLMLPPGFSSRMVARSPQPVAGTAYSWPVFSDGQATFKTLDGGWILVTNHESIAAAGAGASAIRFAPDGAITSAYRILAGTNVNCAGGPTPWGTWLSCEEVDSGLVWECDPAGVLVAQPRPALGVFKHEAVTVDPVNRQLYLTEDTGDGGFYRFTPQSYPNIDSGALEAAAVDGSGNVTWLPIPDPTVAQSGKPVRQQAPGMAKFQGGEGIWYAEGVVYFTTKGDKVVWAYDTRTAKIEKLFDRELALDSSLDAVDNVTVTAVGDVLVCEDGGNLEIGLITSDRQVSPLLRFDGPDHEDSEVTGSVFDPSGTRLYCTSQRAFPTAPGVPGPGAVYEIRGPFRLPIGGVPPATIFGPPAGQVRPEGPLNPGIDDRSPAARLASRRRITRRRYLRRGTSVRVRVDEAASIAVTQNTHSLAKNPGKGGSTDRPKNVVLARATASVGAAGGTVKVQLPPARGRAAMLLGRRTKVVPTRLHVSVVDAAGNESVLTSRVRIDRKT